MELNTNDPAVVISEDADLSIITIIDVPHPNGIIVNVILLVLTITFSIT